MLNKIRVEGETAQDLIKIETQRAVNIAKKSVPVGYVIAAIKGLDFRILK